MNTMRELTDKELDAVSGGASGGAYQVIIRWHDPVVRSSVEVPADLTQADAATEKLDIPVEFAPIIT